MGRKYRRTLISCTILSIFLGLLLGLLGYGAVRAVTFDSFIIGDSMAPTLKDGEYTTGADLYRLSPALHRGDIISFQPPFDTGGSLYVKRIIGLPGETVAVEDGKIYIDGSDMPLDEPYLNGEWTEMAGPYLFSVPEGHYLVMGDNRNVSYDSRCWDDPYVGLSSIRAKTLFVYRPLSCARFVY